MKKATKCMYLVAFVFVDGGWRELKISPQPLPIKEFFKSISKSTNIYTNKNFCWYPERTEVTDFNSAFHD